MVTRERNLVNRWPEQLIGRIAARDFLLVLGAGVSKGCTNASAVTPPGWGELLQGLAGRYTVTKDRALAARLIKQNRFLEAAELVRVCAREQGKEQDFLTYVANATDGGPKPEDQYQPSELHDALLRLQPNTIVTTNYDRILERATNNGYNVHRYDSTSLGADIRSGNPTLIKIHGSVDSASELILTQSD